MPAQATLNIGVLAVQGAVSEHADIVAKACRSLALIPHICLVKNPQDITQIDALLMPGGESTAMSRLLGKTGLHQAIQERIAAHSLPILGTCAGLILLAKKIIDDSKDLQLLHAMDIEVSRNAFGRQKESFEQLLDFAPFPEPINAVFIRGPVITKVWNNTKILATLDGNIVAAQQHEFLALAFHPELTDDTRIHRYFIQEFVL